MFNKLLQILLGFEHMAISSVTQSLNHSVINLHLFNADS